MIKIRILSIGKWHSGPEKTLFQKYVQRLPPRTVELIEIIRQKNTHLEALEIAKRITEKTDYIIGLDEKGTSLSTRELQERITKIEDSGLTKRLVFIIGGTDGLDPSCKSSAHFLLSFGKNTWPHMLMRGLLAEQLYRVHQLKIGHPYHRD